METKRTRKAKKEHDCWYGQDKILPGQLYIEETIPPWVMTSDDPEGSPFPLGEWLKYRYHSGCYYGMYG